ncbi:hypothetical protein C8R45DRAFT_555913 [Mycena sanguinolenta]|nr:hypothetical protein C8R45DRAFT_555913 [Mycena sanguinolenta]
MLHSILLPFRNAISFHFTLQSLKYLPFILFLCFDLSSVNYQIALAHRTALRCVAIIILIVRCVGPLPSFAFAPTRRRLLCHRASAPPLFCSSSAHLLLHHSRARLRRQVG